LKGYSTMTGILKGIKVLEIANWVAAPSACSMLADLGAEVVKIEHPETGDPVRSIEVTPDGIITKYTDDENTSFEQLNRGKKSIGINLAHKSGQLIVQKLAAEVDILVTNLVPERQGKYKLRYEDVQETNPKLIYVTLTGYGVKGEEKDRLGFDYAAFWARSGIMSSIGNSVGPPAQQRPGMGDQVTSLSLTTAIGLALFDREKTGKGQKIECSLLQTGLWVLGLDFAAAKKHKAPVKRHSHNTANNPLSNYYKTKNEKWIQLVMFDSDRFWPGFCKAMDIQNLGEPSNHHTASGRKENSEALIKDLQEKFASQPIEFWGDRLDQENCIWAPIQTLDEVIVDPQIEANEYTSIIKDSHENSVEVLNIPIKFNGASINPLIGAPVLGQDTETKLLEIGFSWEDISKFKDQGAII